MRRVLDEKPDWYDLAKALGFHDSYPGDAGCFEESGIGSVEIRQDDHLARCIDLAHPATIGWLMCWLLEIDPLELQRWNWVASDLVGQRYRERLGVSLAAGLMKAWDRKATNNPPTRPGWHWFFWSTGKTEPVLVTELLRGRKGLYAKMSEAMNPVAITKIGPTAEKPWCRGRWGERLDQPPHPDGEEPS